MARTELSVQNIDRDGLNPTYSAAIADGHKFQNDGERTFLHVKNGDASGKTITLQTPQTVDGLAVADRTVTVPAGEERLIGPLPQPNYNQSDGMVYIDYSAITSVTVGVFKVPA